MVTDIHDCHPVQLSTLQTHLRNQCLTPLSGNSPLRKLGDGADQGSDSRGDLAHLTPCRSLSSCRVFQDQEQESLCPDLAANGPLASSVATTPQSFCSLLLLTVPKPLLPAVTRHRVPCPLEATL